MTTFSIRLRDYVAGCFSGIWIESREPQEAMAEISQLCRNEGWQFANWNIDQGLRMNGVASPAEQANDPFAAIKSAQAMNPPGNEQPALLVLENFHRFIGSVEIVQAMVSQLHAGKQTRTILVVLAPVVDLPPELEKLFVIVEHELPDRDQLREIAEGIGTEDGELPSGYDLQRVLDAASGLTRGEAESAFSLSLVQHGNIQPATIWELKSQMLKKSGLLEMYRGGADFAALGGMQALKSFCQQALNGGGANVEGSRRTILPRGVMLLSPPGCGKSQFCKALGRETNRPVITLDVGSLMGSLVGQTEQRTRQALGIIDAMGQSIVMVDEIEKSLAGVGGSGQSDSGVSARMFGTFLTWLNDRESDSFIVCTANDATKLPPEFARAERFDGVFFLDLPTREEKDAIWDIYFQLYDIAADQQRPDDHDWTGAEIKACCRLSVLLNQSLEEASLNVVPVAVTAAESIGRLRDWAAGRCLDATVGGIYQRKGNESKSGKRRRNLKSVGPAPSAN